MSTSSHVGNSFTAAPADWTIMLYIAADDTLANFAVESLKQLHRAAKAPARSGEASVVVAANFTFPDASKRGSAKAKGSETTINRQYIFESGGRPHDPTKVRTLPGPLPISAKATVPVKPAEADTPVKANMSEQEVALKQFLYWATEECRANRYALILWGHGPELLLQPPESNPNGDRTNLYFTPEQLRGVLTEWEEDNETKLEIIGFDACAMSMFEMAYELKGLAQYMVASQDDVPDASFPYDNLIALFRKYGNDPDLKELLGKGVDGYASTYKDCICNENTDMKPVTLSVLDLNKCDPLKEAVSLLADALSNAKDDPDPKYQPRLADLLIEARKTASQDYAGGLYVDLHDFCTKLTGQLDQTTQKDKWKEIGSACKSVLGALNQGTSNFILKNSNDDRGHGVSIYLPYLTYGQYAQVGKPLVKGGPVTHSNKGYTDILNGAATEYMMCARRNLILDTENYYGRLKFADTHWYDFIAGQWTRALIEKVPAELDHHYSAQQSWMNVCRCRPSK